MKEGKNKKGKKMKRQKENKKMEKDENEINRGPSKNQTHKIKEEIKLVGNGNYM
jgi:hypothetical protein